MGNPPTLPSKAWYHDNLSLDHETFAKGFGLSLEAWNELRATMSKRALEVKRPISCYGRFCPRDIALLLYKEDSTQISKAPGEWTFNALEHVVKEAYSTQAEYDERFKDDYTPGETTDQKPVMSDLVGAGNRSAVNEESTNSVETVTKNHSFVTKRFASAASSPSPQSSCSSLTPSASSEETAPSRFVLPTRLPLPKFQRDRSTLSTRIDPLNKALKLQFYIQFEKSGYERLIGVFSTQFLLLTSKISSPPMVSLELVQKAALKTIEQTIRKSLSWVSEVEEVFLDKWSVPDLAINDDITLNTAINEILEQGNTTATLRIPILSSCSPSLGSPMLRSSGEITRPRKVARKVLTTPVRGKQ